MTENRDRAIGLLLLRAARIANFDAAQGWPDALTLDELAALQYPEEGAASGTGLGPSHDRPNQTDFYGLLAIFAKRGEAAAVKVDRPMPGAMDDKWPCDALGRPALKGILQSAGLLPSELVGAWLGTDWQATPSPADWGSLSPEEKRAAWETMSPEGRREKAAELVGQHGGNKTAAGEEVGISGNRIGQLLKETTPEQSEAPLPVNQYTILSGLAKPKRGKDSP